MNHFSMEGTTCWCCGHAAGPGDRASYVRETLVYRACLNCWRGLKAGKAEGEVRAARNRDVEGIKALVQGEEYRAQYWEQTRAEQKAMEFRRYAPRFLDQLRCKVYADAFAQLTHDRAVEENKKYRRVQYLRRKEALKKAYEEGGGNEKRAALYQEQKEQRRLAYAEGGGKEAAAQRYKEKKAKAVLELEQLLEVKDE